MKKRIYLVLVSMMIMCMSINTFAATSKNNNTNNSKASTVKNTDVKESTVKSDKENNEASTSESVEEALSKYYAALEAMQKDNSMTNSVTENVQKLSDTVKDTNGSINSVLSTVTKNAEVITQDIPVYSYSLTPENGTILQRRLAEDAGLSISCMNAIGTFDTIIPQLSGGKEYVFLPSNANLQQMVFTFSNVVNLNIINKNELVPLVSNQIIDITPYLSKVNSDGVRTLSIRMLLGESSVDYNLEIMQSANIPAIYLTSEDPVNKGLYYIASNKTVKIKGSMDMVNPDGSLVYAGSLSQIKTRGNSTWAATKKPFQIKLDKKTDLTGTGLPENENKTWILLANAYDPTLIHNKATYDMAAALGLNAPDSIFVDLYFDGRYMGNYLLAEKVEQGKGRVNINDNGYLLEMDLPYYLTEDNKFVDVLGTPFVIKYPEEVSDSKLATIQNYMNEVILAASNNGISPNTGMSVSDLVDLESLAKMYVLEETVKDPDAFVSSAYFYLPEGGKLTAGPVWDFDSSYGIREENNMTVVSGTCSYPGWIGYFLNLSEFKAAVKKEEATLYKLANELSTKGIDKYAALISSSQKMDDKCWQDFDFSVYKEYPTYKQDISHFKSFLSQHNSWFKNYVNKMK